MTPAYRDYDELTILFKGDIALPLTGEIWTLFVVEHSCKLETSGR
jgi:hypothetical protein